MKRFWNKVLGGILLVSGTAVGAGMLALPVSTGLAGFLPSLLLLIVCWLFMTYTAFLMLEVTFWMKEHTNLISMAKYTLGRWGEIVSWITYLFLLYALTTAYIAGSGPIVLDTIYQWTGVHLPAFAEPLPLLLIFGFFVYKGATLVDYANRFLMISLVIAYVFIVGLLLPHVDVAQLAYRNWKPLLTASSVVVTSFGFHIIIPTLSSYLHRNLRQLKLAILIGSIIPIVVYAIWELLALGIIPLTGPNSIAEGYESGKNGAELMSTVLGDSAIGLLTQSFAFCAIVTSFLGVSLSLTDFLADGLKIKKSRLGRIGLYLLTFIPPFIITLIDPRAFLSALEYAGAFGVIILLGLLPALMVWRGRYHMGLKSPYKAPGGKCALLLVIIFSLVGIGLEIYHKFSLRSAG